MTVSPELALAVKVSALPSVWVAAMPDKIVYATLFTTKLTVTTVASAYTLLPACDAVMVHVPLPTIVAVVPDTLHTLDGVAA